MIHLFRKIILLLLTIFVSSSIFAQVTQDTSSSAKKAYIEILEGNYTDILKVGQENVTKIVGDVKLRNGSDILYCDSAVLHQNSNMAEAFGNVVMEQADGTTGYADYIRYTGGSKLVLLKGNVVLSDPKGNTLWSETVDYNLNTKVGTYSNDGTLQNETTVLSSHQGSYNMKTNDARFTGDVVVNDPEYKATSEDMSYNTETKLVRFYADAIIQNEGSTLFAKPGSTYDAIKKQANFKGRSNIIHGSQFIESDFLDYNQNTGWAIAKGNVIAIDTSEKATVFGGLLLYNELSGKMMVTDSPLLRRLSEKDTLYTIGDTVFSEPIINLERPDFGPIDTAKLIMDEMVKRLETGVLVDSTKIPFQNLKNDSLSASNTDSLSNNLNGNSRTTISTLLKDSTTTHSIDTNRMIIPELAQDSMWVDSLLVDSLNLNEDTAFLQSDSTNIRKHRPARIGENPGNKIFDKSEEAKNSDEEKKPRYFLIYHNVLVYSDSAQAKCDSMRYSQSDSLMILYKNPVIWGKGAQIIGDTIYSLVDSNKIYEVYVPKNAILIQRNGPEAAGFFDQIQANRLHAFFVNNELDSALAYPNAETIYFPVDDDSAYLGASKASSDGLKIEFKDQKIERIIYRKDFKQTMTPITEVDPTEFRLSRFNWRESERPKTLKEFLEHATMAQRKMILAETITSEEVIEKKAVGPNKKGTLKSKRK